jgi:hypothetical protein
MAVIYQEDFFELAQYYTNLSGVKDLSAEAKSMDEEFAEILNKIKEFEELKKKPKSLGNSYERAKTLVHLSTLYGSINKSELAFQNINEAIELFSSVEEKGHVFRKVRVNKANAYKSKALIFQKTDKVSYDSIVKYCFKALEQYETDIPLLRRVCNKDIAVLSKEVFEWLRFQRISKQGLLEKDSSLSILLPKLNVLLDELEKCYKINPGKYGEIIVAAYLYASEVYSTTNETSSLAEYCARNALEICDEHGWLGENRELNLMGIRALKKELHYYSVVYRLIANANWQLGNLANAQTNYLDAKRLNKSEGEKGLGQSPSFIFYLPLARIAYELNDTKSTISYSNWGLNPDNLIPNDNITKAHFHFISACAKLSATEPLSAQTMIDSLRKMDLSNYAFADYIEPLSFLIEVEKCDYKSAMDILNSKELEPSFYEQLDVKLEASYVYCKNSDLKSAILCFESIDPDLALQSDSMVYMRYCALKHIFNDDQKNGSSSFQGFMNVPDLNFYYHSTIADLLLSNYTMNKKELRKAFKKTNELIDSVGLTDYLGRHYELLSQYWGLKGNKKKREYYLNKAASIYLKYNLDYHFDRIK